MAEAMYRSAPFLAAARNGLTAADKNLFSQTVCGREVTYEEFAIISQQYTHSCCTYM